jgi:hypothetical protein
VTATSRHEKRQKKGRQQQQQQQRKRNTPELDDAGTGNPRRLGNLMRGMRLASAITAASSLSLSLSLSLFFSEPQAIRSLFFLLKQTAELPFHSSFHPSTVTFNPSLGATSSPYTSFAPCYLFWHNPPSPSPSPIPMRLFFSMLAHPPCPPAYRHC